MRVPLPTLCTQLLVAVGPLGLRGIKLRKLLWALKRINDHSLDSFRDGPPKDASIATGAAAPAPGGAFDHLVARLGPPPASPRSQSRPPPVQVPSSSRGMEDRGIEEGIGAGEAYPVRGLATPPAEKHAAVQKPHTTLPLTLTPNTPSTAGQQPSELSTAVSADGMICTPSVMKDDAPIFTERTKAAIKLLSAEGECKGTCDCCLSSRPVSCTHLSSCFFLLHRHPCPHPPPHRPNPTSLTPHPSPHLFTPPLPTPPHQAAST